MIWLSCEDTVDQNVPKQDPILHFKFSGNSLDESGFGHHGVVLNAMLTNDSFGNGQAAYLFQDSSLIEVLDSDWLDFHTNQLRFERMDTTFIHRLELCYP